MAEKYSEEQTIAALKRLAARWPRNLTLASMDGELVVLPTGDYLDAGGSVDPGKVIATIGGIPNTGGGF